MTLLIEKLNHLSDDVTIYIPKGIYDWHENSIKCKQFLLASVFLWNETEMALLDDSA